MNRTITKKMALHTGLFHLGASKALQGAAVANGLNCLNDFLCFNAEDLAKLPFMNSSLVVELIGIIFRYDLAQYLEERSIGHGEIEMCG